VGCEINVTPPNPGSDALHEALGFIELERRDIAPGKVIRYMRKML
jgi:predicted GNAT superfamily acetyltransferase